MIVQLSEVEAFQRLCRVEKKWGVFISWNADDAMFQVPKAAPYVDAKSQLIGNGHGLVLCSTEKEAFDIYERTVGDDGPTKLNKYKGKVKVYALVINSKGELTTENT